MSPDAILKLILQTHKARSQNDLNSYFEYRKALIEMLKEDPQSVEVEREAERTFYNNLGRGLQ